MRLAFLTQALAQATADSIHARMIAADQAYAASVTAGQTTAWAVPLQDMSVPGGQPIGLLWYVNCKARCMPVLSAAEVLALVADKV